jgi:hypothetical protein
MDPACTQVGCGRNLPDGQPTFVGGFDRPHSFDMSIGQTKICGSQPFNKSLLVLDALSEGFVCLHAHGTASVHKTGQLKATLGSVAPQHPIFRGGRLRNRNRKFVERQPPFTVLHALRL